MICLRVLAWDSLAAPLGAPHRGAPALADFLPGPPLAIAGAGARPRFARTPWPLENLNVRLAKSHATR